MGSHPLAVQALQLRRPGGGPIDTVAATCTHEGGGTSSFLHAFTHPNRAQYQSVTLDWGFAHGQLTGWIPVGLELAVWTDDRGLAVLAGLANRNRELLQVPGFRLSGDETVEVSQIESYGNGRPWRARGESREVSTRVRVRASLGGEPAKSYVYRESVRAGMVDLVSAILEDRLPQVAGVDVWASLATATAAREAAQSAQPVVPAKLPADLSD
jgi:hypothetical protein